MRTTTLESVYHEAWPTDRTGFDRLVARHAPVVFKAAAADWLPESMQSQETLSWLGQLVTGNPVIQLTVGLPQNAGYIGGDVHQGQTIPTGMTAPRPLKAALADMAAELERSSGHVLYIQSLDVASALPALRPYLKLPLEHCPATSGRWRAWIGTGSHYVGLHIDGYENFFCVLAGCKRFTLAPHDVLPDVYVGPLEGGAYGPPTSVVNPKHPDVTTYPRFAKVLQRAVTVELAAGDVLYVPCHWWHYVESTGMNVSANYWWKDLDELTHNDAQLTFLRALLHMRRLPPHWRDYWKCLMDHFVFCANGDPYSHLPVEKQGYAGYPNADRLESLRQMIETGEREAQRKRMAEDDLERRTFRLSPSAHVRFGSDDNVVLREATSEKDYQFPMALLGILVEFRKPNSVDGAVSALAKNQSHLNGDHVRSGIKRLIADGFLVPAV